MLTPRQVVFADAMSPQRFAQEATLRAQDVLLRHALEQNPPPEITEEYAGEIAKEAVEVGHATAERYDSPPMPK